MSKDKPQAIVTLEINDPGPFSWLVQLDCADAKKVSQVSVAVIFYKQARPIPIRIDCEPVQTLVGKRGAIVEYGNTFEATHRGTALVTVELLSGSDKGVSAFVAASHGAVDNLNEQARKGMPRSLSSCVGEVNNSFVFCASDSQIEVCTTQSRLRHCISIWVCLFVFLMLNL